MNIVFPPVLNSLAKGMAIVGALGILVMSARDKKNPLLRLALGAYDLYNITGWVSDVLSYSRLLALGLQPALSHRLSTRWEVWLEIMYLA